MKTEYQVLTTALPGEPHRLSETLFELTRDENWEVVTSLGPQTLLLRRKFSGPEPMTIAAITNTVLDAIIAEGVSHFSIRDARGAITKALLELSGHGNEPVSEATES